MSESLPAKQGGQSIPNSHSPLPAPVPALVSMILPPLLLVFSTCRAVLMPCSDLPSPRPSWKPYLAMILAATELTLQETRGKIR